MVWKRMGKLPEEETAGEREGYAAEAGAVYAEALVKYRESSRAVTGH
jgi:hypothetical protein